jgi:hypothetical protein
VLTDSTNINQIHKLLSSVNVNSVSEVRQIEVPTADPILPGHSRFSLKSPFLG